MIYFTSDWHLYHENVLTFANRPCSNLEEMHRLLINNYNSTVSECDTCYFGGDIGFADIHLVKLVISQLNSSNKILILGNHDKRTLTAYSKMGFNAVLNSAVFYYGNKRISISHCPLIGKYREDTSMYKVQENWHGETRPNSIKFCTSSWARPQSK